MIEYIPVSDMSTKELMIEYVELTFVGITEIEIRNIKSNRFKEIKNEIERRKQ